MTQSTLLQTETAGQRPFLKKFGNLLKADANSLFERGYYCNFPLESGYPGPLDDAGLAIFRDIVYLPGSQSPSHHSLDVFVPENRNKKLPVFLFVHGGAWRSADKREGLHVHENLCIRLSRRGVLCVNVNHRLAPAHSFPTAEQDVAAAVKWVSEHIEAFGGDARQVFLSGHSSGGHITALLATDCQYLSAAGVDPSSIKGVISISGVLDVGDFYRHSRFQRNFSVRPYFGDDPAIHEKASPVFHADHATPPFLLLHASEHDEGLDIQAQAMESRLREVGVPVARIAYPNADHFLVLSKINEASYTLTDDIFSFIQTHCQ